MSAGTILPQKTASGSFTVPFCFPVLSNNCTDKEPSTFVILACPESFLTATFFATGFATAFLTTFFVTFFTAGILFCFSLLFRIVIARTPLSGGRGNLFISIRLLHFVRNDRG